MSIKACIAHFFLVDCEMKIETVKIPQGRSSETGHFYICPCAQAELKDCVRARSAASKTAWQKRAGQNSVVQPGDKT